MENRHKNYVLILSPEGEKRFKDTYRQDQNKPGAAALCQLFDKSTRRVEQEGSWLRVWTNIDWYMGVAHLLNLQMFVFDNPKHCLLLEFNDRLIGGVITYGEYVDHPFEVGFGTCFTYRGKNAEREAVPLAVEVTAS